MGMIEGGSFLRDYSSTKHLPFLQRGTGSRREINGKPIQVDEDNFIVRDGNTAIWYGADGNKIDERQLTEES